MKAYDISREMRSKELKEYPDGPWGSTNYRGTTQYQRDFYRLAKADPAGEFVSTWIIPDFITGGSYAY